MTPKQLLSAIARLFDGNQSAAARFTGISPRQMRRIVAGEREIPKAIEMLFRVMVRRKIKPADVEAMLPKEGK